MAGIYLTKDELNYIVGELAEQGGNHQIDTDFRNIWKKCNDKLEKIDVSKELKKLVELQEEINEIKKSVKNKRRKWGY